MIKSKKLKLTRETVATLSDQSLVKVWGGASNGTVCVTRGIGCEPTSGIRPCE
jgi:hypothetical protein